MLTDSAAKLDPKALTKLLTLMFNLIRDYFELVPEKSWLELAEALRSQHAVLRSVIDHDPRPQTTAGRAPGTLDVVRSPALALASRLRHRRLIPNCRSAHLDFWDGLLVGYSRAHQDGGPSEQESGKATRHQSAAEPGTHSQFQFR